MVFGSETGEGMRLPAEPVAEVRVVEVIGLFAREGGPVLRGALPWGGAERVDALGSVLELLVVIEVSGVGKSDPRVRLVIGVDVARGEGFPVGRIVSSVRSAVLVDGRGVDSRGGILGTGPARSGRRWRESLSSLTWIPYQS